MGGPKEDKVSGGEKVTITVNNKAVHMQGASHTGQEIKVAADVPGSYELFLVHEPGERKPDEQIPNDKAVALRNGTKFRAIPPGDQG